MYQFIISEQYATSLWNPWRRDASNTLLTKGRAVEVYQNLSFLKVPFQDQDLRTTASSVITAIEVVSQSRSHFANFLLRTCCKSDNDTTKQSKHNANSNSAQLQFANNIAELLFAHFPHSPPFARCHLLIALNKNNKTSTTKLQGDHNFALFTTVVGVAVVARSNIECIFICWEWAAMYVSERQTEKESGQLRVRTTTIMGFVAARITAAGA